MKNRSLFNILTLLFLACIAFIPDIGAQEHRQEKYVYGQKGAGKVQVLDNKGRLVYKHLVEVLPSDVIRLDSAEHGQLMQFDSVQGWIAVSALILPFSDGTMSLETGYITSTFGSNGTVMSPEENRIFLYSLNGDGQTVLYGPGGDYLLSAFNGLNSVYLSADYTNNNVEIVLPNESGTLALTSDRAAILGYREYVALLSQTGTGNPSAVIIRNELSGPIVWTRNYAGNYSGTLVGAFTVNKTDPGPYGAPIGLDFYEAYESNEIYLASSGEPDTVTLRSFDPGLSQYKDGFTNVLVRIKVYD